MQCCEQVKYGKVLNLLPDNAGNMFFRGEWNYNPEYNTGDVVICRGKLYLARKHHAGKDPSTNPKCWKRIGVDMPEKHPQPDRIALYGGAASLRETVNSYEIQLRIDSAINWEASNPLLGLGEAGVDITNMKFKVGNGIDRWNTLPYMHDDLYMLIEGERQERTVQATDLQHQLEDDELYVTQEINDLQQLNRVLCSSMNDLEYKRRLYEHKITQQLKTERTSITEEITQLLGLRDELNARLDAIIGDLTTDSEIIDARFDAVGEEYQTAGANIRKTQSRLKALHDHTGELQEQIDEVSEATLRLIEILWKADGITQEGEEVDPTQSLAGLYSYIQEREAEWSQEREQLQQQIQTLSEKVDTLQSGDTGNDTEPNPEQGQGQGNNDNEDTGNIGDEDTDQETDIVQELSELLQHRYAPPPPPSGHLRHHSNKVTYQELIWILGFVVDKLKDSSDSSNTKALAAIQASILGLQSSVQGSQSIIQGLQTSTQDLQESVNSHQSHIDDIEIKLNAILAAIEDGEIMVADADVIAMIEAVFAGELDGSDVPNDGVIEMLDNVFAGNEQLNDGDSDDDFNAMLDEVFGDNS